MLLKLLVAISYYFLEQFIMITYFHAFSVAGPHEFRSDLDPYAKGTFCYINRIQMLQYLN